MSLPKWTKQKQFTDRNWGVQMDRYHKALEIAWDALEEIRAENTLVGGDKRIICANMTHNAIKAMLRIEELDK